MLKMGKAEKLWGLGALGLVGCMNMPCSIVPAVMAAEPKQAPVVMTEKADKPTEEKFDDWSLVCRLDESKKKVCMIGQELQGKNENGDKGRLLRLSLFRHKEKKEYLMVALLPLGISIPAGAAVVVDDGAQVPMALQRCTNAGCESLLAIDDALLQKMKKGTTLKVGFNAGEKTLVVPVPLKGFAAAVEKAP